MSRSKVKDRAALEERIGYSFADKALPETAPTHIFNVFRTSAKGLYPAVRLLLRYAGRNVAH
jgi:hypothetical protein